MVEIRKYFAELVGTLILVFMGCGSAVVLGVATPGAQLEVALVFGLSIIAAAYVIGPISGCHINPAVSLALLINKKIGLVDFIGYVIFQIIGAIIGAALLYQLVQFGVIDLTGGYGSNSAALLGTGGSIFIEIILTFFFVFAILGVTRKESTGSVAGIVIGLTLTFVHIVGIPLTGTSVNPARSIGPALFAGGDALGDLWIFIAAPLIGAAIAAGVFIALYGWNKSETSTA
ncbi:MAG: aquaporin [Candidatus Methanoplasma sp.]|nr:aquaporin [Candidatus Methanoplasma sp.]